MSSGFAGLFCSKATPTDLAQQPPVIAPTPEKNSLIEELTLSDDDGAVSGDDAIDDDDDADDDGAADEDNMFNDDDDDDNDNALNKDMETSSTSDTLPSSLNDSLEGAQEARPLASTIKMPKPQRKKIGRRPAKLLNLSSIPARKPTAPTLFAGQKKFQAPLHPPDPGNSSADSALHMTPQPCFYQFAVVLIPANRI